MTPSSCGEGGDQRRRSPGWPHLVVLGGVSKFVGSTRAGRRERHRRRIVGAFDLRHLIGIFALPSRVRCRPRTVRTLPCVVHRGGRTARCSLWCFQRCDQITSARTRCRDFAEILFQGKSFVVPRADRSVCIFQFIPRRARECVCVCVRRRRCLRCIIPVAWLCSGFQRRTFTSARDRLCICDVFCSTGS